MKKIFYLFLLLLLTSCANTNNLGSSQFKEIYGENLINGSKEIDTEKFTSLVNNYQKALNELPFLLDNELTYKVIESSNSIDGSKYNEYVYDLYGAINKDTFDYNVEKFQMNLNSLEKNINYNYKHMYNWFGNNALLVYVNDSFLNREEITNYVIDFGFNSDLFKEDFKNYISNQNIDIFIKEDSNNNISLIIRSYDIHQTNASIYKVEQYIFNESYQLIDASVKYYKEYFENGICYYDYKFEYLSKKHN